MTLNEHFVSYKIALSLKSLRFNEECLGHITEYGNTHLWWIEKPRFCSFDYVLSPTIFQAIDWIREVKGIEIEVSKSIIKFYKDGKLLKPNYQFLIDKVGHTKNYLYNSADESKFYECPKKALLEAIQKAIELINKTTINDKT